MAKVRAGTWSLRSKRWQRVSDDAKELVMLLLQVSGSGRCTR